MGSSIAGTLDYAAPEQRFGLPVDARCDVFSLAVLAYELLTGRLPGRVYTPASQFNARLSPSLDKVLQRGLARRPADRYPTPAAAGAALQGILASKRATKARAVRALAPSTPANKA